MQQLSESKYLPPIILSCSSKLLGRESEAEKLYKALRLLQTTPSPSYSGGEEEAVIVNSGYGAIWLHFAVRPKDNRGKMAFMQT